MGVWLARLIVGVLLAAIGLGTPPPGTELEAGGGPGAYHYGGGCDSAENFLHFTALQLRARHLMENGFVLAAETSGQRGVVDRTTGGPDQIGRVDTLFAAALRAGYEGRYGGAEIGPGLYRAPNDFGTVQNHWLPSVKLWLGRYGIAHAWASVLADRTLPTNRLFGFGVGHASERAKVTLGLAGSAGNDATVILDADVGVTPFSGWAWAGSSPTTPTPGVSWRASVSSGTARPRRRWRRLRTRRSRPRLRRRSSRRPKRTQSAGHRNGRTPLIVTRPRAAAAVAAAVAAPAEAASCRAAAGSIPAAAPAAAPAFRSRSARTTTDRRA